MAYDRYTTPLSVTSQFFFCGLPLRLDTYRGCGFQCAFCFARQRGGNAPDPSIVPADAASIQRTLDRAFHLDENRLGIIGQLLKHKVPIHFGGMSDPFQPIELRYKVTQATLALLAQREYPTVISTRGVLVATAPYLDLLQKMKSVVVQFSLSSSCDDIAQLLEPRSSSPSDLLRCMEVLSQHGIPVTCRWQPYVPGCSESPAEFAQRVGSTGCSHISFEHLKVPLERKTVLWQEFVRQIRFDPYELYRQEDAVRDGREFVLPTVKKLDKVLEVAAEVRRYGMTFGAADNEFQYLSDTGCCCSGVDRFPGFENYFKHQIGHAIRKCRGRTITYSSIAHEWAPTGSIDRFLNSKSRISRRNRGRSTMIDYVKLKWNQPGSAGSPSSFFGIGVGSSTTSGSTTYEWHDARAL